MGKWIEKKIDYPTQDPIWVCSECGNDSHMMGPNFLHLEHQVCQSCGSKNKYAMSKQQQEDLKQAKARNAMFRRIVPRDFNLETISSELYDMYEACNEVVNSLESYEEMETLCESLLGDDEMANEFRISIIYLSEEMEHLIHDLDGELVCDCFDDLLSASRVGGFTGGYLGYDSYREDFFPLDSTLNSYGEEESEKRINRLTKKEILEATHDSLRLIVRFLDVKYRYESMDYAFQILRGENARHLQIAQGLNEIYEELANANFSQRFEIIKRFDAMALALPQEVWIQ